MESLPERHPTTRASAPAPTAGGRFRAPSRRGPARSLVEAVICLALAVVLFRTFEVEGYMISTGSMAPALKGFHKRVVCPGCGWHFACGVEFDESVSGLRSQVDAQPPEFAAEHATCPNCGEASIDLSRVPRNQGDQLLVSKTAYDWKPPQRWDVVVFRNPNQPTQAYVKRVAGLPGERVQVLRGDVYADDHLQRKSLSQQRAMRIPVFDQTFEPPEEETQWGPRWVVTEPKPHWVSDGPAFEFDDRDADSPAISAEPKDAEPNATEPSDAPEWLTYRHWVRYGEQYVTRVLLSESCPAPKLPSSPFCPVQYEAKARMLQCVGTMSTAWRDDTLALNEHEAVRTAIQQLYVESHIGPVTDDYGYNRLEVATSSTPVRDLMVSTRLTVSDGDGALFLEMTDGAVDYRLEIDLGADEVRLRVDSAPEPIRREKLPAGFRGRPTLLEMSLFDRQVLAVFDGKPAFAPLELAEESIDSPELGSPPRRPARWGARRLVARLDELVVYRDVHYTRGRARHGVDNACELGSDEYFMLGDNSPVSSDSRNWDYPTVPRRLILGKPFLVHLPSRPGQIRLGAREYQIRIPDFAAIRYIR